MRILKLMFASVAAATLLSASAAQSADPVKIRLSWVAPVTNWASILLEKKDLAQHLGKSYTLEPVRFAGTPPMVTALANGELEVANLAYSTLAIAIECRHGRSAHHRRRIPRWGRRLLFAGIHGARGRADQESRRPQGQGGDDQRRRQRGRRRDARDAAQVRP